MHSTPLSKSPEVNPEFLSGGGELGERIRTYDWTSTSLGPVNSWPQSLKTCIRIMLTSRQPIWIGWGKDLIKFYNDPYKAIVGGKHPVALGQPASIVWKDIWMDIEPMLKKVMEDNEGTYVESQLLLMERNGYPEETYYTFSYTPIPGDNGNTEGMICANTEDTYRIISERQLHTLTELGKHLTDCKKDIDVFEKTIEIIKENPHDFPFALFYQVKNQVATKITSTHSTIDIPFFPQKISLTDTSEIATMMADAANKKSALLSNLHSKVGNLPSGAWKESPDKAVILTINAATQKHPYGFLVLGLNPYRLFDEHYQNFINLICDQVASSIASVHSLEEERQRAEKLAEIDRAKTVFFSNISHEFRTPLTLLLGPIEDALQDEKIDAENKKRLEVAHRNAGRLLKLVNSLLDFSRIEAGKMQLQYEAVNISFLTRNLANTFSSAIEKAGIKYTIDCEQINEPVYVDVEMYENMVLNLLSNALKYTSSGEIELALIQVDKKIKLSISDTGAGIPENEFENIFKRFHRIQNVNGRSQEGTGIGLSLVQELVNLHQGKINVISKLGKGSTFTIFLPIGNKHLDEKKIINKPQQNIISSKVRAYVDEAMKWLPGETETETNHSFTTLSQNNSSEPNNKNKSKATIILADDNADMRDYIKNLLGPWHNIQVVNNGLKVLELLSNNNPLPDLIISDVMMPEMNGFELVKKLKSDPLTTNIPVILLSARAGEEATVEGLQSGADDYLVKPFSAKELFSRVETTLRVAKSNKANEKNLRNILMQAPLAVTVIKGPDYIIELANDKALELWGKKSHDVLNKPVFEVFPELIKQGFGEILNNVYKNGQPFIGNELPVTLVRNGVPETLYINFDYEPLYDDDDKIIGILGSGIDVTELVTARKKVEESEQRLSLAISAADLGTWDLDILKDDSIRSLRHDQIFGYTEPIKTWGTANFFTHLLPEDREDIQKEFEKTFETGSKLNIEVRILRMDNEIRWVRVQGKVLYNEENVPVRMHGTVIDITDQKNASTQLEKLVAERTKELKTANLQLERSNVELEQFAHVASHDLKEPLRKIKIFASRLEAEYQDNLPSKAKTFLDKILSSADRMYFMMEGVLLYSGINSSEQTLTKIDVNEIIQNVKVDLELIIQQKKAIIETNNLPVIEGAEVLIYQMFYNLLSNSLKFTKTDVQPVISIKASPTEVDGKAMTNILVKDNGIGFEKELAQRVFNTFTRLHSKEAYEGTGLGLALCKKIAERHHGTIEAWGEKNIGAEFTVVLPINQDQLKI